MTPMLPTGAASTSLSRGSARGAGLDRDACCVKCRPATVWLLIPCHRTGTAACTALTADGIGCSEVQEIHVVGGGRTDGSGQCDNSKVHSNIK